MNLSQTCVLLSEQAYRDTPAPDVLARVGAKLHDTFDDGDTQGFLARLSDGTWVVAFRGTERGLGDIKTDLDARFYRTSTGRKTHRGFLNAWQKIKPQVYPTLPVDSSAICFTGHSLGGALATVAADDLHARAITFGSPRVSHKDMQRSAPHMRYTYGYDIIPRLPTRLRGFAHAGRHVHLKNPEPWYKFRPSKFFTDHRISRYVDALGLTVA